ncbi:hypothetical protein A5704_01630 [Mycobacterium sp. E735]|nr:hypothetical protein A5704_01630 [Mycobacterium sp. E735]
MMLRRMLAGALLVLVVAGYVAAARPTRAARRYDADGPVAAACVLHQVRDPQYQRLEVSPESGQLEECYRGQSWTGRPTVDVWAAVMTTVVVTALALMVSLLHVVTANDRRDRGRQRHTT